MQYDRELKAEALRLSDEIGIKKTSEKLGIPYYTLSGWRSRRGPVDEKDRRIAELEHELDEVKQLNKLLQETLSHFIGQEQEK